MRDTIPGLRIDTTLMASNNTNTSNNYTNNTNTYNFSHCSNYNNNCNDRDKNNANDTKPKTQRKVFPWNQGDIVEISQDKNGNNFRDCKIYSAVYDSDDDDLHVCVEFLRSGERKRVSLSTIDMRSKNVPSNSHEQENHNCNVNRNVGDQEYGDRNDNINIFSNNPNNDNNARNYCNNGINDKIDTMQLAPVPTHFTQNQSLCKDTENKTTTGGRANGSNHSNNNNYDDNNCNDSNDRICWKTGDIVGVKCKNNILFRGGLIKSINYIPNKQDYQLNIEFLDSNERKIFMLDEITITSSDNYQINPEPHSVSGGGSINVNSNNNVVQHSRRRNDGNYDDSVSGSGSPPYYPPTGRRVVAPNLYCVHRDRGRGRRGGGHGRVGYHHPRPHCPRVGYGARALGVSINQVSVETKDPYCICGQSMLRVDCTKAYLGTRTLYCNSCGKKKNNVGTMVWRCPLGKIPLHSHGYNYVLCEACAAMNSNRNSNNNNNNNNNRKTGEWGFLDEKTYHIAKCPREIINKLNSIDVGESIAYKIGQWMYGCKKLTPDLAEQTNIKTRRKRKLIRKGGVNFNPNNVVTRSRRARQPFDIKNLLSLQFGPLSIRPPRLINKQPHMNSNSNRKSKSRSDKRQQLGTFSGKNVDISGNNIRFHDSTITTSEKSNIEAKNNHHQTGNSNMQAEGADVSIAMETETSLDITGKANCNTLSLKSDNTITTQEIVCNDFEGDNDNNAIKVEEVLTIDQTKLDLNVNKEITRDCGIAFGAENMNFNSAMTGGGDISLTAPNGNGNTVNTDDSTGTASPAITTSRVRSEETPKTSPIVNPTPKNRNTSTQLGLSKSRSGHENCESTEEDDVNTNTIRSLSHSKSVSSNSMFVFKLDDEKDIIIRCEIDFIKGIRVSFDNIPQINTIHCTFDENVRNDFIHNLNHFWNNIYFYDYFEKSIEQAMEKYDEHIHKTSGGRYYPYSRGGKRHSRANENGSGASGNGNNNQDDRKDNHNNNNNNNDNNNGDDNRDDDKKNNDNHDDDEDDNDFSDDEKKVNDKDENQNQQNNLREIMNLRGVCQCSGDCGNTLIKGSILFYKNILNGNVSLNLIDERKHLQLYNDIFWPHLFKYCFNNNIKREYLADIICFVEQMWKTVPVLGNCLGIEHLISKHRWLDEKNEDQWQQVLLSVISDSKQPRRMHKIHYWVMAMFYDIFSKQWSQLNQTCKVNPIQYILNRCFRAIIIHSYRNGSDMKNDFTKRKMSLIVQTSLKKTLNGNGNELSDILHSDIFNQFDQQAIESISGHNISEFTAMKLILLAMSFLNECHSTLDMNLKCIDISRRAVTFRAFNFEHELIKHGFLNHVIQMQPTIDQLHQSKRNKSMIGGNKLTKSELTAIRLWTIEQINQKVKQYHFKGNSCEFREFSLELMRGLKKLKKYDSQFDIYKYKQHCQRNNNNDKVCVLYNGYRDVSLNPQKQQTQIGKLVDKQCPNHMQRLHGRFEEYCWNYHTFTSTTTNFDVALQFAKSDPIDGNGGVVLEISDENLFKDRGLIFGDVSWISEFPDECEILFAPCMLDIYQINFPKELEKYSNQVSNQRRNDKVTIAGTEMVSMQNISCIMNNLKEQCKNGYNKSVASLNTSSIKLNINSNKQLTKQETKIKQSIVNAFDKLPDDEKTKQNNVQRCFEILIANSFVNKATINLMVKDDTTALSILKSFGIDKVAEQLLLLQELRNIQWDD